MDSDLKIACSVISNETVNINNNCEKFLKDGKKSPAPRSTKSSRGREKLARDKKTEQDEQSNLPIMTMLTKFIKGKNTIYQNNSVSPMSIKPSNAIHAKYCKNVVPLPSNKYTSLRNEEIDTCKVLNTEHPPDESLSVNQAKAELSAARYRINELEDQVTSLRLQLDETANKLEVSESTTSYLDKKIEEIQDTYFNKWFAVSTQICDTEKKYNKSVIEYESKLVEKKIVNERLEKEVDALQKKIANLERKYYVNNNSILYGRSMDEIQNIILEKESDITKLNKRIDYLEKKIRSMKIETRMQRIEARKHNLEPTVSKSHENNCYKNEMKLEEYKLIHTSVLYENDVIHRDSEIKCTYP